MTPPSSVSAMVRMVKSASVPPTVRRESSTIVGTWMPWSPSRCHWAIRSARNSTGSMLHQWTPTREPTSQAVLIPTTTAASRWALAQSERTMVRSTTRRAAIGA
jgi:hypothetical protein